MRLVVGLENTSKTVNNCYCKFDSFKTYFPSLSPSNTELICEIKSNDTKSIKLLCRIDTVKELEYYKQGGILQYVLNSIIKKAS